jgi:hypothetical protein
MGITLRMKDAILAPYYARPVDLQDASLLKIMHSAVLMEQAVVVKVATINQPLNAKLAQIFVRHALPQDVLRMGV